MENVLINDHYSLADRKPALPTIYRIEYRIVELLLIVKLCSIRKSITLDRLYNINTRINYGDSASGDGFIIHLLKYVLADKLITLQKNGSVKLTSKGINVTEQILEKNLFKHLIEQINKVRI